MHSYVRAAATRSFKAGGVLRLGGSLLGGYGEARGFQKGFFGGAPQKKARRVRGGSGFRV